MFTFLLAAIGMAAFGGATFQRALNKTLQSNEEKVNLFVLDYVAEGTAIKVGHMVKRGTDATYQALPDSGTYGCLGQVVGFWYPNGHKLSGVYENNPATAIPAGSDLKIAAPQSGLVTTVLIPNGVTATADTLLKNTSNGRYTNLTGADPTAAEGGLPLMVALETVTAAADDAQVLARWS